MWLSLLDFLCEYETTMEFIAKCYALFFVDLITYPSRLLLYWLGG